jgi:tagatose 6-phosphate kinase
MITTVTLNPMLDKTVYVGAIQKGKIQRASKVEMLVGGKGINVSRQLSLLGCDTLATGFIGGEVGTLIERLLNEEGIANSFIHIAGMTREGVTYREDNGTVTAVFEPPHHVSHEEALRLVDLVQSMIGRSDWVICSGSSPCPEADDVYAEIISSARRQSINTVLDSYGTACRGAAATGPTILKMNKEEFEQTFGTTIANDADFGRVLTDALRKGISCLIITDGPHAVYAGTKESSWKLIPPRIMATNPTGSGDCMVAGILYGYTRGLDFRKAMALGAAAGAANAQRWEVAASSWEEISALESRVTIEPIT